MYQALEEEATPTLINVWKDLGMELVHEDPPTEDEAADEDWEYEETTSDDEDEAIPDAADVYLTAEEKVTLESDDADWQDKMKIEFLLHERKKKAEEVKKSSSHLLDCDFQPLCVMGLKSAS